MLIPGIQASSILNQRRPCVGQEPVEVLGDPEYLNTTLLLNFQELDEEGRIVSEGHNPISLVRGAEISVNPFLTYGGLVTPTGDSPILLTEETREDFNYLASFTFEFRLRYNSSVVPPPEFMGFSSGRYCRVNPDRTVTFFEWAEGSPVTSPRILGNCPVHFAISKDERTVYFFMEGRKFAERPAQVDTIEPLSLDLFGRIDAEGRPKARNISLGTVRWTKGKARYTKDFQPLKAPFPSTPDFPLLDLGGLVSFSPIEGELRKVEYLPTPTIPDEALQVSCTFGIVEAELEKVVRASLDDQPIQNFTTEATYAPRSGSLLKIQRVETPTIDTDAVAVTATFGPILGDFTKA